MLRPANISHPIGKLPSSVYHPSKQTLETTFLKLYYCDKINLQ